MAISNTYCTHRDLKDIYPNVDEYDVKTPIFGWEIDDNYGYAYNTGLVTMLYSDGKELGAPESSSGEVDAVGKWFYDADTDRIWYFFGNSNTNPNNKLMEAGEDYSTLITRTIKNASRYFDSRVDAGLPRDQWKDKEGNFDYLVIRTTALIAAYMLINSKQPGSDLALTFLNEVNFNIEQINTGKSKLNHQVYPFYDCEEDRISVSGNVLINTMKLL